MTKERIEIIRQSVIPFVKKELLDINYEGLGVSDGEEFEKDLNEVLDLAIKALEKQPFINKLCCVSEKVCEHDKNVVLDKIRAEINGMHRVILKGTPKDDWAVRWNDCLNEVLQIIKKYKAESEVDND